MFQAAIGLLYLGHVMVGLAATGEDTCEDVLPKDVASPTGAKAVIKCRLASQNVAWTFCPKDGSPPYLVADNCNAVQATSDTFGIDRTNHACHLVIKKMSEQLAGTYTCQDLYSNERGHSAQLTVAPNVNQALKKNATQSHTYTHTDGIAGLASYAVDGVADGEWSHKSCTHTPPELAPWWAVDLGEETAVGRVRITNRNIVPERLSNFYIGLTNVSPWTSAPSLDTSSICKFVAANPPAGVPTDFTCDAGTVPGRYLFVLLKSTGILTICELEAYYY